MSPAARPETHSRSISRATRSVTAPADGQVYDTDGLVGHGLTDGGLVERACHRRPGPAPGWPGGSGASGATGTAPGRDDRGFTADQGTLRWIVERPETAIASDLDEETTKLTVDTYGKWLPMGNKAAVDALDSPSGSKVVANASQAGAGDETNSRKSAEPPAGVEPATY